MKPAGPAGPWRRSETTTALALDSPDFLPPRARREGLAGPRSLRARAKACTCSSHPARQCLELLAALAARASDAALRGKRTGRASRRSDLVEEPNFATQSRVLPDQILTRV
eukprot:763645-Hanusia_phi.AAC.4